uniref:RNA-directed RNA polymerase n=1 Tax=Lepidopteran anphe-related virus OKIAV50 TaxID=2746374 RepID=A0A7D7IK88_9MONO|nr:RNA-dependent RNA polymerase [Lepidopteran anphe-related virus OKIAV50]
MTNAHSRTYNLYGQRKPRSWTDFEPRVLARYLKGDEGELAKKILDQENFFYNHSRDDIVQLCRKERELNLKGRVFCKQTYEMRLMQVCMEKSLSDNVLPYVREQTMTNTELEVAKRMDKVASHIKEKGHANLNLDLSSWNQLNRHDLNKYLFHELDELHGRKNLYSDSHLWFNRCMVLLSSRLTPPEIGADGEPLAGDYCHYNQHGGFEGMRQKAWTLTTIMIIKIALEECNIQGEIMGQGDNQIIHIRLNQEQQGQPHFYIKLLLNSLDYLFRSAGLSLKLQETWYSQNLFEYSKVRYYKSIRIDDSLKRLNRMIPDINEGFPSLQSLITGVSTTTENMSRNYVSPIIPFFLYSLELGNTIRRKGILDLRKRETDSLCALMNIPSVLGGLPLSNMYQHCQRGCPDPLTIWLRILGVIKRTSPRIYNCILHLIPCTAKTNSDPTANW